MRAVAGEHVELGEAAGVEQQVDALAGGELAARVLALDGGLGAGVQRLLAQLLEAGALLLRPAGRLGVGQPALPACGRTRRTPRRSTPQTSPTVARARSASRIGGSRLAVPRAAARTSSSRASTAAWSRAARSAPHAGDLVLLDPRVDAVDRHGLLVVLA